MKQTKTKLAIFEGKQIRRHWDAEKELWYFSVVDMVSVLSNSTSPLVYWRKLKERLKKEGSETVTKCHGLKMLAAEGKMRLTDVADTETMFRIIQSIPSPNAEPFKLWLARVGYERIEEAEDPERAINRAMRTYLKKGYSLEWINQRLKSIEIRKELTDEWEKRGAKEGLEFSILTDDITFAWAGLTTKQYKRHKGLKMQSLRDNMTNLELVLNMLAEVSTTEISQKEEPDTFDKNRNVARRGGGVARVARRKIETETGKNVISKSSYLRQRRKRLK
ncbi:hypothetical protein HZB78_04470 [Candidatus Collierbacteria bacterium]|nr:hypothetical protein [Candidatus Collierbacteria bacterium]